MCRRPPRIHGWFYPSTKYRCMQYLLRQIRVTIGHCDTHFFFLPRNNLNFYIKDCGSCLGQHRTTSSVFYLLSWNLHLKEPKSNANKRNGQSRKCVFIHFHNISISYASVDFYREYTWIIILNLIYLSVFCLVVLKAQICSVVCTSDTILLWKGNWFCDGNKWKK